MSSARGSKLCTVDLGFLDTMRACMRACVRACMPGRKNQLHDGSAGMVDSSMICTYIRTVYTCM